MHRNETVVTPIVGRIAESLFNRKLAIAGECLVDEGGDHLLASEIEASAIHHQDPESMQWLEEGDGPGYYISALVDGVEYAVRAFISLVWRGLTMPPDWRHGYG